MHDVTLECVAVVTDHFGDAFVRKNVERVYMTLWRRNDVQKLTLTPFCFEKSSVRKGIFNVLSDVFRGPGTNCINISHESKTERSSEAIIYRSPYSASRPRGRYRQRRASSKNVSRNKNR